MSPKRFFSSLPVLALLPGFAVAQSILVQPQVRVVDKVSNASRITVSGSRPAMIANAAIGARVDAGQHLTGMILTLKPTDDQEIALRNLLDQQQDKKSASFHKWLTPAQFGATYGVASSDIAQVTAWLTDNGLSVEKVSTSGRFVQFGGTVGTVEAAFSTEMHTVTVNGESHVSNITELSIPQALAPVVKGMARLNDFFPKSNAQFMGTAQIQRPTSTASATAVGSTRSSIINSIDPKTGTIAPQYGNATSTHYVAPGDVDTIFNANPLLTAGIDGTGQSISILARSNINLSDVAMFRSMFNLSTKLPKVIVVGTDPGLNGDAGEAYLDAEWSGAIARNADINFIVSGASFVGEGIDTAGLYAVDNNVGDIISLSYGGCEGGNGPDGTAFWNTLWEQAAAQGQTAMVSTGDSGAAGCDSSSATYATGGLGVNALGSSAFNVAVGGSMFVDFTSSQYWGASGTTVPFTNALSYIPEAAWNQGKLSKTYLNSAATATVTGSGIVGTGGGVSIYTARPSWQTGSGIGADPTNYASGSPITGLHRLVPDLVSVAASGHDATLYCAQEICSLTNSGTLANAGLVGGTSVATPVWASAQALINQKNGGRQGNANYYYYKLADAQYTASATACQSVNGTAGSPTVTLPASTCNLQDIVSGSNRVPTSASDTTGIGYDAGVGYDEASGLGSANITNMANNWSTVAFNSTATTFTLSPQNNVAHGSPVSVTFNVSSGAGTPTGDVSLIASTSTSVTGSPQTFTLSSGTATGTISNLAGGTYAIYAHYSGDGTFAASDSLPITVNVVPEASAISFNPYYVTTAGGYGATSSFTYGVGMVYVDTEIAGASGNGTATGTVTYKIKQNGTNIGTFSTSLDTYGTTFFAAGPAVPVYYLTSNFPTLNAGSYTLAASYSGDGSFKASTANTTFTVAQIAPTVTFVAPATVTSGQSTTLLFTVATPASSYPASGTVTFTDTTTGTVLGSASLSNGQTTLTTTGLVDATGATHSISAAYAGDVNFKAASSTASTLVSASGATTLTVTVGGTATPTVNSAATINATLSTAAAATSSFRFFVDGAYVGSASIASGATTSSNLTYTKFTGGTHTVTAVYAGAGTTQNQATGSISRTVTKYTFPSVALSAAPNATWGNTFLAAILNKTYATLPAVAPTGSIAFHLDSATGAVAATAPIYYDPSGYYYYVGSVKADPTVLTPGAHAIVGVYSGDASFNSVTSASFNVNIAQATAVITSPNMSVSAGLGAFTVTANVAYSVNVAPTGAVTFTINGTSVTGSCTGSASPLTCTASFSPAVLANNNNTLTVSLAADSNYTASTGTATITSVPDTTGTALSSTVLHSTVGQSVALTATVKDRIVPANIPTGTVTFYDGGTAIGTASVGQGGVATLNYAFTTTGEHDITASYAPKHPNTYAPSTSTVTQPVKVGASVL